MKQLEWLKRSGVPSRYRCTEIDLALIPPALVAWAEKLPDSLCAGGSALLVGPPGGGKTTAAAWWLEQVYALSWLPSSSGRGRLTHARFLRAGDLVRTLLARDFATRRDLEEVEALVIDDQGVTHDPNGWGAAEFDELLEHRWSEDLSTVVTTNLPPDTFQGRYPRAHDRLIDSAGPGVIEINRQSLRSSG